MASMRQNRKDALATLERYRDGKLQEDGTRKTSRLASAQEEYDAATKASERVAKRLANAENALKLVQANIAAAEGILTATDALAEFDGTDESDDDETADSDSPVEFDDEDGDADESDDDTETVRGPGGRFVSRTA